MGVDFIGSQIEGSALAREETVTVELALLACLPGCPPLLGQDWDLKMPVSWDLANLEHDAVPAIAAATATAAPLAAASSALSLRPRLLRRRRAGRRVGRSASSTSSSAGWATSASPWTSVTEAQVKRLN